MKEIAITFDQDWAPDFALDYTSSLISELEFKNTWFMTNRSPACVRLMDCPDVEVGIHPNFLQGSTQGKTPNKIMQNLLKSFPEAKSVRSHAMVYSASIARLFAMYKMEIDSSIYLGGMDGICPLKTRYNGDLEIVRMPYYWSDDGEVGQELGWKNIDDVPGLKILCFHPLHIFLNTDCWETYLNYKNHFPKGGTQDQAVEFVNHDNFGAADYLEYIVSGNQKEFRTLSEIRKEIVI